MAVKTVAVPHDLNELGFVLPGKNAFKRVNALVKAHQKCGKTNLICTGPEPIAILGGDEGTRGVVERHRRMGKVIYVKEYEALKRYNRNMKPGQKIEGEDRQAAIEAWAAMQKDYYAVLNSDNVKTIGIDTVSEWWNMSRFALWGASSIGKNQFGPLNMMFSDMYKAALKVDKHVLFITRLKKEYSRGGNDDDDGSWDGKSYEIASYKDGPFCVENNVSLSRGDDGEFQLEVTDSRVNGKLYKGRDDSRLSGPDTSTTGVNFTNLAKLLWPGTEDEDWE